MLWQILLLKVFLELFPGNMFFIQLLHSYPMVPPNGSLSLHLMDSNAGFHLGGVVVDAEILSHSQQPCFNIFSLLTVTFERRRLNLPKFSLQFILSIFSSSWRPIPTAPWFFRRIRTFSLWRWRVTRLLTLRGTFWELLLLMGILPSSRVGTHLSLHFI